MSRESAPRNYTNPALQKIYTKLDRQSAGSRSKMTQLSTATHSQAYKDKTKPTDIRSSNINAAKGNLSFKKIIIIHFLITFSHTHLLFNNFLKLNKNVCHSWF